MSTALRVKYIRALSQGGIKQAQEILGKAADGAIRERVAISQNSLEEIEQVMRNPLRRGRISPFVRSGGVPIVPGSSVKGALRTAWLTGEMRLIPRDQIRNLATRIEKVKPGKTGIQSDEVHQAAFDLERGHTEQDALRDISVSDASIESDGTVIDRVHVANCTKEGPIAIARQGAQIHVERLASIADAGVFAAKPFKITLSALDQAALAERRERSGARAKGGGDTPRAIPSHSPRLDELRQATNAHHTALWFYERHRFYEGTRTDTLMDALLSAFGFPADQEKLQTTLNSAGALLLKVGRYSHFESKSVQLEDKRYGEKRGRKGREGAPDVPTRFMPEGGSRTVAQDSGGRFLPFGWVLLLPKASAPKETPTIAPAGEARTPGTERPRPSADADNSRIRPHEETLTVPRFPDTGAITLKITTPLRLQSQGHPVPPENLRPRTLFTALLRRASLLFELHAGMPPVGADASRLAAAAERLTDERSLQWKDWTRFSSRQKREMTLGGVIGEWKLSGDLDELLPWFWLGQWLHVGKETTMGMGKYSLEW
jgi:hypothetical protein